MHDDQCFSNTYLEPLKHIASGGMGEVFLARDTRLDREVAVKVLKKRLSKSDESDLESALSEARLMARVNHPNIVQLYDVIDSASGILLVMEFVNGRTLAQYQKQSLMSLSEKLELLRQISLAISYSHERSVLHCDIKATNILITDNQVVKVTDFGIASISDRKHFITNNDKGYGSYGAMSPEQVEGKSLTQASDIFSFGILAYELVYQRHPFGTDKGELLAKSIVNNEPLSGYAIESVVSHQLEEFCRCLLQKSPQDRPKSMVQVVSELENILLIEEQGNSEDTVEIGHIANTLTSADIKDNHTSTHRGLRHRAILPLVGVIFSIVAALLFVSNQSDDIQYAIVLEPEMQMTEGFAQDGYLTKSAIDNAVRQAVINTDLLELVAYSSNQGSESLASLVKSTGADIVLVPKAKCDIQRCHARLSLLSSDKLVVEKEMSGSVQSRDFMEVDTMFRSLSAQVLGNSPSGMSSNKRVNPIAYRHFAYLYNEVNFKGQYTRAHFDQAIALLEQNPNFYSLYSLIREIGLELYYIDADKRILERLKSVFQSVPREYSESKAYLVDKLYIAIESGQHHLVEDLFDRLALYGESALVYHLRGNLAQGNYDLPLAIANFKKSLQLNPNLKTYFNLANALYDNSQITESRETLEYIRSEYPWYKEANKLLADIHFLEGNILLGITLYNEVGTGNMNAIDHNNLALGYMVTGNGLEALKNAQKAVSMSPDNTAFILNLADINILLEDIEQAHNHYRKVIELNNGKQDFNSYLEIGQAYAQTGQHKNALEALYNAIKLSTDKILYAYSAAIIYTLSGETKSGFLHFKESIAGGYEASWFDFPWFRPLCHYDEFKMVLSQLKASKVCKGQ
ncbi:serine/threonine-protein kinase [Pseudoalteromonas luteoviolacea]|uniref:Protein kinase domain-containing protein n=1 Tax=Pseudoalteromonas luteoviolacea NCIMB 1942 TaxID=1365253 RepID=A0A167AZX5_9GAMM|nr:serine/threonine-protein kinase [Pseudoalteromonas luteoviolacea]KZN45999.1 hypothetical protein N482_13035 [Pseudoalteromonas luteoviolacea NCIMB 1942]